MDLSNVFLSTKIPVSYDLILEQKYIENIDITSIFFQYRYLMFFHYRNSLYTNIFLSNECNNGHFFYGVLH